MASETVRSLARTVADEIRVHGHLLDVYDPEQGERRSLFRSTYRQADRKTRKGFIQELNKIAKAEKRREFLDDFFPIASLMVWEAKVGTEKVLETLDKIVGKVNAS